MADRYVRRLVSSKTLHPDGSETATDDLAVWTLAHRCYSGSGRLDVWMYPTPAAALAAGADLAMASGMDPQATRLFAAGRYAEVLERYEQTQPDTHVLRVQAAYLQPDDPQ